MMYANSFSASSFGFMLHCLFVLSALIGGGLLIYWMVKNLNKKDLLKFAVIFLLVGLVGAFLTAGFMNHNWSVGNRYMPMMWDEDNLSDEQKAEMSDWRDNMVEEMDEHMGITEEK